MRNNRGTTEGAGTGTIRAAGEGARNNVQAGAREGAGTTMVVGRVWWVGMG